MGDLLENGRESKYMSAQLAESSNGSKSLVRAKGVQKFIPCNASVQDPAGISLVKSRPCQQLRSGLWKRPMFGLANKKLHVQSG